MTDTDTGEDDPKQSRGPDADRLKIDGPWEDAIKKALEKEKPEGGWPESNDESDDGDDADG